MKKFLILLLFLLSLSFNSFGIIRDSEIESLIKEIVSPIAKAAKQNEKNLKIFIINDDQVNASLDLFVYRSKPNLKVHDNSISIEKINNSIPKVPNEALPNNLKWKNDIFSVSRLSNKKGVLKNQKSFKKEYLLTQIILSKPLGAIINNKLYPLGSIIGPYTVSKIDETTVVLSGQRKSIVLELEVDEDQSVYSLDGFKKAFSSARKNNQNTFIYRGKLYSTRLNN